MQQPKVLKVWEDEVRELRDRMPQVCFNCFHVLKGGVCGLAGEVPPADFAEDPGACPDWKDEVPF